MSLAHRSTGEKLQIPLAGIQGASHLAAGEGRGKGGEGREKEKGRG